MMIPIDVSKDPRLAGKVIRYHTWAQVGPHQSVGEHSWQVARILLSLVTGHTRHVLLEHAIIHDIGEVFCGDIPYPIKQDNIDIKIAFDAIERLAVSDMIRDWDMYQESITLTEQEKWAFKLAEFIEMWEWGFEQRILGNKFADLVGERMWLAVQLMLGHQNRIEYVVENAKAYMGKRMIVWGEHVKCK